MTCVWSLAIWRCFWGGLPHHMDDASTDPIYAGAHLPLVHFSGYVAPGEVQRRLIAGSTLLIKATDASDVANFPRWDRYNRSGDPLRAQQAVSELLLRLERVRSDAQLVPASKMIFLRLKLRSNFRHEISLMSAFIAEHFLDNIECNDIAAAAGLHPEICDEPVQEVDWYDIERLLEPHAPFLCSGKAAQQRRQHLACRYG